MQCARCGYVLAPFEGECPKCKRLDRTQHVGAPAGDAAGASGPFASFKNCPACGQPAVRNMAVCGRCGWRYATPKGDRWRVYVSALALIAVVAIVIGTGLTFALTNRAGWLSIRNGLPNIVGTGISPNEIDRRLLKASASVGGELEVSLAWNTLSDLDLEVREPSGELINAYHPRSSNGGVQDVDANPTLATRPDPRPEDVMPLPDFMIDMDEKLENHPELKELFTLPGVEGKAKSFYTRHPIEHIYFRKAPLGDFAVYARCYSWREPNSNPLPFTIEVRVRGCVINRVVGTLGPANYVADRIEPTEMCRFHLP